MRDSKTMTDEKSSWLIPNTMDLLQPKEACKIDFTSAKTKKNKTNLMEQ